MKIALIFTATLIIIIGVFLIVLGKSSKSGHAVGLVNGELQKCPDKPNCVCSEQEDDTDHFISPIVIPDDSASLATAR